MKFLPEKNYILVNYHYVEDPREGWSGLHPCSVGQFGKQVAFLSGNYNIVSIPDIHKAAKEKKSGKYCAITFDDGLHGQYLNAVPVLKRHNATATIFLIGGVFDGILPRTHRIHVLLSKAESDTLIEKFNTFLCQNHKDLARKYTIQKERRITDKRKIYDDIPTANFKETMNMVPEEVSKDFLDRAFGDLKLDAQSICNDMFMDEGQARELLKAGLSLESHAYSHCVLDLMGEDEMKKDIKASTDKLEKILGKRPTVFSYPHNAQGERVIGALKKAGYRYAVTTQRRSLEPDDSPFLMPRYDANDIRDYISN